MILEAEFSENTSEFDVDFGEVSVINKSTGEWNKEEIQKIVKEYLEENPIKTGSTATIGYVELLAKNWTGDDNLYSQIVTIDGVDENSQVDLTPTEEQLKIWRSKEIAFTTKNVGGVVTVYAIGQKPENDYTIQVTITEVKEKE